MLLAHGNPNLIQIVGIVHGNFAHKQQLKMMGGCGNRELQHKGTNDSSIPTTFIKLMMMLLTHVVGHRQACGIPVPQVVPVLTRTHIIQPKKS
jgi:hypothetical protein